MSATQGGKPTSYFINSAVDKVYSIRTRQTNQITIPEFINVGRVLTDEPWSFREHPQYSIEFHYIVSGGMRTWIDRQELVVEPGRFYFVEPGQLHREESLTSELEFYYLKFNILNLIGEPTALLASIDSTPADQILPPDDGTLRDLFLKIFSEATAGAPGCQDIIESYALTMFWEARRRMGALPDETPVAVTRKDEMVGLAQRYIEDHLGSPFSLVEVARSCAASPDYLSRIFKEVLGVSPSQFSARMKIEVAKEWLATSSKSVREIASALGFQDEHYFSRRFKAMENLSPTQFRRSVTD